MKSFFKNSILYTSVIVMLCIPTLSHAKIIDRIAAQVNKDIFTLYDVSDAAPAFLLNRQESPQQLSQPGFFETIQHGVIQDMVERKLFEDDAKTLNISITDDELNRYLAGMRQQQGFETQEQQEAALKQYGISYRQFLKFARSELLRMRLITIKLGRNVSVSERDVQKRYEEVTGRQGDKKPYIDVSHINLIPQDDTAEAKEEAHQRALTALQRLKNGEEFTKVAEEMSDDTATASEGGHIGKVFRENILPAFGDVAFNLPVNQVSELVETPAGYHIILVLNRGEEKDPNAEKVKDYIRSQLIREQQEIAYQDYIQKLKQRNYIDLKLSPEGKE